MGARDCASKVCSPDNEIASQSAAAAIGHGVAGVNGQVHHHLLDLMGSARMGWTSAPRIISKPDVLADSAGRASSPPCANCSLSWKTRGSLAGGG